MKRYCPICEQYSTSFKEFGFNPRQDALCPHCNSLERDRLIWLYIKNKMIFFKNSTQKMLHVAPEAIFQKLFQNHLKNNYLSADLHDTKAMVKMDITSIDYDDDSFDYIYCSHVLEHIVDDMQAMKELYRVLKHDGWAILLVPIMTTSKTFEDYTIVDPNERLKVYGHPEHVRNYGIDYPQRLSTAGFNVDVIYPCDFLTDEEIELMGITPSAGEIYFCTK